MSRGPFHSDQVLIPPITQPIRTDDGCLSALWLTWKGDCPGVQGLLGGDVEAGKLWQGWQADGG